MYRKVNLNLKRKHRNQINWHVEVQRRYGSDQLFTSLLLFIKEITF